MYTDERSHPYTMEYKLSNSESGLVDMQSGVVQIAASEFVPDDASPKGDGASLCVPLSVGALAIMYNLESIIPSTSDKHLHLDYDLIVAIYNGTVSKWNDPHILSLNPHIQELENHSVDIVLQHRSEASGATLLFTSFLSEKNEWWREHVGMGTILDRWPVPPGKGYISSNIDMVNAIAHDSNSIGYASLGTLLSKKSKTGVGIASIFNSKGKSVSPNRDSLISAVNEFEARLQSDNSANQPPPLGPMLRKPMFQSMQEYSVEDENAPIDDTIRNTLPPYDRFFLYDLSGEDVYPMSAFSFLCIRRIQNDTINAKALLRCFEETYIKFQAKAEEKADYGFVGIPTSLVKASRWYITDHIRCGDSKCRGTSLVSIADGSFVTVLSYNFILPNMTDIVTMGSIMAMITVAILFIFMIMGLVVICLGVKTYQKLLKAKITSEGTMTQKLLDRNECTFSLFPDVI